MIAAMLLLAAFVLALFHFHAGEDDHCPVCRLVAQFSLLVVFAVAALIVRLSAGARFAAPDFSFTSLLLPSTLQGRAPPSF